MKLYLVFAGVFIFSALVSFGVWKLQNLQDKSKGESVQTEHAKVHAKSKSGGYRRVPPANYIHFYIPERDTVVVCKVPQGIWEYLPKNDWGMLYHQGGTFFSFRRDCDGAIITSETYTQICDL